MAEIYNYTDHTLISGTSDNDRIFNGHIEELEGSVLVYEVLKHGGNNVSIHSYAGDDYIFNGSDYARINSGTGNDTVESRGQRMNVVTGKGNDSVHIAGGSDANATISTSEGNDTIYNFNCGETSINSGDGDDVITNDNDPIYYEDVSVMAGSGNDTIYLPSGTRHYSVIQYINGDGNDIIHGFDDGDTLQISDSDYSTMVSGNEIVINVGSGKITLVDSLNKSLKIETNVSLNKYPAEDDENEKNDNNSNGENNNPVNSENQNNEGNGNSGGGENIAPNYENENNQETKRDNSNSNVDTSSNNYEGFYSVKDFEELFKDEEDSQEEAQQPYWTPKDLETFLDAFNFYLPIPKVENVADVTARVSSILDSTIKISDKIAKGELSGDALKGEALKVVGDISAIIGDVKDLKGKDSMGWALSANILESAGSWISVSGLNEVELTDEEKELVGEAISATGDLGMEVAVDVIKKIANANGVSDAELRYAKVPKKIKSLMNVGLALMMVGYEGCNQFRESIKEGFEEELPVWAVAEETFADGIMAGFHGGGTQLTRGLDDLAFKGLRWLAYKLKGDEPVLTEKTYTEWIAEFAKRIMFGTSSNADTIDIQHDGEVRYAQDGNDYIRNMYSNVKIYGGAGKDTISSYANTTNNFISGGDNRDRITSNSDNSTIQGDNGADKIIIFGSDNDVRGEEGNDVILLDFTARKNIVDGGNGEDVLVIVGSPDNTDESVSENKFYGEAGNDHIYLFGAKNSTVRGGAGYDYIVLEDTYNTVIEYNSGHGKDVIVGYNETDTISFREETAYSTVASGNDITIYVGDGQIFLQGANGKTLNISQGFSKEDTKMENRIKQQMQLMGDLSIVRSANIFNLRASASEGELTVTDARDNLIDIIDAEGNTTTQVYMSKDGGEVAANALGNSPEIFKVLVGSPENKNHLIAGDGGASLVGGDTDDILEGGIGHTAFSYHSGNDTIKSYKSSDEIIFDGTYIDFAVSDNDLVLNAAEGSLRIQDAKNKWIDITDSNGDVLANFYLSSEGGILDGRLQGGKTVLIGADNADNQIFAGEGGSTLWGGNGGINVLVGGNGEDMFKFGSNDDLTLIQNASSEDTINLYDLSIDDIKNLSATTSGRKMLLRFGNDAEMIVQTSGSASPTFQDSAGINWRPN